MGRFVTPGDDSRPESVVVRIDGFGYGGEGYSRTPDGFLSVWHALPGERVEVLPGDYHRGRAWGRLVRVLEPAGRRVDPKCSHYDSCTGCALRHIGRSDERSWKLTQLAEILERYGPSTSTIELKWVGPEERDGHRERANYQIDPNAEMPLGFRGPSGTHSPIPDCPAQSDGLNQLVCEIGAWLKSDLFGLFVPSSVEILHSQEGHSLLVLKTGVPISSDLLAGLRRAAETSAPKRLNIALLGPNQVTTGRDQVTTLVGKLGHQASPFGEVPFGVWTHTTLAPAEAMYGWVGEHLRGQADRLLDVCSGVGGISIRFAHRFSEVLALDVNHDALGCLSQCAARRDLDQIKTRAGKVETILPRLVKEQQGTPPVSTAVINPMRIPLGPGPLETLPELGVTKIVYLGPSPVSAAKDARILAGLGYEVVDAAGIDLQPGTGRVMLGLAMRLVSGAQEA
ncbi:MAG: class I SAM-dependent RNA methyltransferase [Myxococcales bacterium]|nr:class I SAM-dependent RNA methyltransferase [Myxococcales bacterium]